MAARPLRRGAPRGTLDVLIANAPQEPQIIDAPVFVPSHDLHNHTVHCGHAADDATVANLVARADTLGLSYLGLSEHVIFAEHASRIEQVRGDLAALDPQSRRAQVLVGVEIDLDPHRFDGSWIADPGPVDYAILSPHLIPEYGAGQWEFEALRLSERETRRLGGVWLDWYEAAIDRGGMQILGHPLREPVRLGMLSLKDTRTYDRALSVLQGAAARSLVFELNNGWAVQVRQIGEESEYVSLMRALKGKGMRFCCGSDSHAAAEVGTRDGVARLAGLAGVGPDDWWDPAALLA